MTGNPPPSDPRNAWTGRPLPDRACSIGGLHPVEYPTFHFFQAGRYGRIPVDAFQIAVGESRVKLRLQAWVDQRRRAIGRGKAAHGADHACGVFRTHDEIDPGIGRNDAAAYAWINFVMRPENAARVIRSVGSFSTANGTAPLIDPRLKAQFDAAFPNGDLKGIHWYPAIPAGLEEMEGRVLD